MGKISLILKLFFSFSSFFSNLIYFFLNLRIWRKSKTSNSALNLPPGPRKLPLIGSLHHLAGSVLPHHRLRDLAMKYGPLTHLQLGELTNIVISSPEIVKQLMKTHDIIFSQRPFIPSANLLSYNSTDMAFSPHGDYWRQLGKICSSELLTASRVRSFRPIREEQTSKFVRFISSSARSPINFSRMMDSLAYSIISKAAFGKIWKGEEVFLPTIKKLGQAMGDFNLADLYPSINFLQVITGMKPKLKWLRQAVDKILENIMNKHRTRKAEGKFVDAGEEEDLVDVLLNIQDKGDLEFPLTTENIKAVILDIFTAGSDTSSTHVDWAMSEMLKNPRVMIKTQEDVRRIFDAQGNIDEAGLQEFNYLKLVIKETLRLHPPVPLLAPRECRESCIINGYNIPEKSRVIVNAWTIGRDPNYWSEAERFYPERFLDNSIDYKGTNFEFIPFGVGRSMCPGISFGMANVDLILLSYL
ncbi:cytochrome P450 71D9-like, partial [Hevea brasiliensis]|uniref:cytochrome P450 71D9-like n=1 Tax=Hevea brasiliensis TaxID=3981 RepID=UPI0025F710DC